MIVGFDTGYFVRLLEGNEIAVKVWQDLTEGNIDAVVSPLTFFELKKLGLGGFFRENRPPSPPQKLLLN